MTSSSRMSGIRRGMREVAVRLGRREPVKASGPTLMAVLEKHLPSGAAEVAVLCGPKQQAVVRRIRDRHPELDVVAVPSTLSRSERHVRLTVTGPFDLILDAATTRMGRLARFQDAFFQLRPGGVYVVRRAGEVLDEGASSRLGEVLHRAFASRTEPAPVPGRGTTREAADAHALGQAVDDAQDDGGHLVVRSSATGVRAKLREDEMNSYLEQQEAPRHRLIELIPSEPFASRCVYRENEPARGKPRPTEFEPPDISLRDYRDVVVTPGQVISDDRVIFPDTYRHNARHRLTNRFTEEVGPAFARLPYAHDEVEARAGAYFHLDNEVRGHFGHLLTEQVSRLWAWPEAKALVPDLKLLLGTNSRAEVQPYEYTVYAAAGVARDDVVLLHEPARVERVLSATPMLSNPEYVHPRIAETWRRVGDNLAATAEGGPRPGRVFCSRRLKKRSCTNTVEVEDLFRAEGFEVIYPEDLPLGDQIETFRSADVIAGFAGSGLFNLCFVEKPVRVVMLSSTAYNARNEYLIASVLGHEIDSITSAPRDLHEFQSPFTFDHAHEGRYLADVFATLPSRGER